MTQPVQMNQSHEDAKVAHLIALAREIHCCSGRGGLTDPALLESALRLCLARGVAFQPAQIESARRQLSLPVPGPAALTAGEMREALVGLAWNTPVLYQRMEDYYFDELGWPAPRQYLFDGSYEIDYLPAHDVHVGKDRAGKVAFCVNLISPAAELSGLVQEPYAALSWPGEAIEELYLETVCDELNQEISSWNKRYMAAEDLLGVARQYLLKTGQGETHRHRLRDIAHQLSTLCNGVLFPSLADAADNSHYLMAGPFMAKLNACPPELPVYCLRTEDSYFDRRGWTSYRLTRQKGQSMYVDVYGCQITRSLQGEHAACLNSCF